MAPSVTGLTNLMAPSMVVLKYLRNALKSLMAPSMAVLTNAMVPSMVWK